MSELIFIILAVIAAFASCDIVLCAAAVIDSERREKMSHDSPHQIASSTASVKSD